MINDSATAWAISLGLIFGTSYLVKLYHFRKTNGYEKTPEPHRTAMRGYSYLPTFASEIYAMVRISRYE